MMDNWQAQMNLLKVFVANKECQFPPFLMEQNNYVHSII